MSDNKNIRGSLDAKRINVHEQYELKSWSRKLGISQDELKEAVKKVGTSAEAVQKFVRRRG